MSLLIINIGQLVTFKGVAKKKGIRPKAKDLSVISNAAILIEDKKIKWIGKSHQAALKFKASKKVDAKQMVAFPGFIDAHTHLIFNSWRHKEFAMRCEGKSYLDIAKAGGGILSSVKATHKATLSTLINVGQKRIQKARSFGITTLEAKSGYGLSFADEIKSLKAISALQKKEKINLVSTFLGAHAFPKEFKNKQDDYVDLICAKMLPKIAKEKLAQFCDIFIDVGFFTLAQTKKILTFAKKYQFNIRIHSDEFKALGGTELATSLKAHSVDHLIAVSKSGINALSKSKTVATLLPATSFFLGKPFAPARKLIDAGVCVALATDFNPGSSCTQNIQLVSTIAATQMKLTIAEVLSGITYNGAKSLGLEKLVGSVEVGKQADLCFFDIPSYEYLPYHFGDNFCKKVMWQGKFV